MELREPPAHSFIVKVWLEETAEEGGHSHWTGHIIHVRSGERRYLRDLSALADFIRPYLKEMGVGSRRRWVPIQWLKR